MIVLTVAAYVASAWVLAAYGWLTHTGRQHALNLANAVGAIPVAAVEIIARTWQPLILTVAFGLIGTWGLIGEWRRQRAVEREAIAIAWVAAIRREYHS